MTSMENNPQSPMQNQLGQVDTSCIFDCARPPFPPRLPCISIFFPLCGVCIAAADLCCVKIDSPRLLHSATPYQALTSCGHPGDVLRLLDEFRQQHQQVILPLPPVLPCVRLRHVHSLAHLQVRGLARFYTDIVALSWCPGRVVHHRCPTREIWQQRCTGSRQQDRRKRLTERG
jgi:hypothetical protein